jgi:hypothetical protein
MVSAKFVDDLEIGLQPHQRRTLRDIVRQPVQRTHPVAQVRQQPPAFDKLADALVEIIHRRIDQRNDQYFLLIRQGALGDDLRRQQ